MGAKFLINICLSGFLLAFGSVAIADEEKYLEVLKNLCEADVEKIYVPATNEDELNEYLILRGAVSATVGDTHYQYRKTSTGWRACCRQKGSRQNEVFTIRSCLPGPLDPKDRDPTCEEPVIGKGSLLRTGPYRDDLESFCD